MLFAKRNNYDEIDDDFGNVDENEDEYNNDSFSDEFGNVGLEDDDEDDITVPPPQRRWVVFVLKALALAAILAIGGYLVFSLTTGPSRKQCKITLEGFQKSCNEMRIVRSDSNSEPAIADYLSPSSSLALQAAASVTDLTGHELDDLLKMVIDALGGVLVSDNDSEGLSGIFKTIKIEPVRYGIPGKNRIVKCRVSFLAIEQYCNITIKKSNGRCYIDHFEMILD